MTSAVGARGRQAPWGWHHEDGRPVGGSLDRRGKVVGFKERSK